MSTAKRHSYISPIAISMIFFSFTALAGTPEDSPPAAGSDTERDAKVHDLERHVRDLTHEVEDLKSLVRSLREQLGRPSASSPAAASPATAVGSAGKAPPSPETHAALPAPAVKGSYLPPGLTIDGMLDGYYEYNFNSPVGRVNNLRAYDVSSNSFSLGQADLLTESAADIAAGKRWGVRVDLMFGQAASTLQANAMNQPDSQIDRDVWQAYGTYVFPVARGLTVDFGKWASSLGIEGNYTKDQLNYSRSLWYDFLPYYHMGFRSTLQLNDALGIKFWVVNGVNQTQDFNGDKDVLLGFVLTPTPSFKWTLDYYQGMEHADVIYEPGKPPVQATLPYEDGSYVVPIADAPNGKLQIASTYLTWQVARSLLIGAQASYVQERLYGNSAAQHVEGGALYTQYRFSPSLAFAAREEYLSDMGGLYTGTTQRLTEETLTLDYNLAENFLVRGEFRRDQSTRAYFLSYNIGVVRPEQSTIGFGLVWWFGQKQGPW